MLKLEIVFFGDFSPLSASHLDSCVSAGHHVIGFVCTRRSYNERRPKERTLSLLAPKWSVRAQLRRRKIPTLITDVPIEGAKLAARLAPLGGNVLVSAGFPGRIPEVVRALYREGAINAHPGLLPEYRGPYPVAAMVLDRTLAKSAGFTVHSMSDGFDEGPILSQARLAEAKDVPLEELGLALSRLGARLLRETLADLRQKTAEARPQPLGQFRSGRISTQDLTVQSGIEDASLDTLMSLSAMQLYPRFLLEDRLFRIVPPVKRIGPATGAPPIVRALSVEFDTEKNRVWIARAKKFRRRLQNWRLLVRVVRAGPP